MAKEILERSSFDMSKAASPQPLAVAPRLQRSVSSSSSSSFNAAAALEGLEFVLDRTFMMNSGLGAGGFLASGGLTATSDGAGGVGGSSSSSSSSSDNSVPVTKSDCVVLFGDMNFRCSLDDQSVKLAQSDGVLDFQELLETDELSLEMKKSNDSMSSKSSLVFKGWKEGKVRFAPTYKFNRGSSVYSIFNAKESSNSSINNDTSSSKEKVRIPSWCDRILYTGDCLELARYHSVMHEPYFIR